MDWLHDTIPHQKEEGDKKRELEQSSTIHENCTDILEENKKHLLFS